MDVERSEFLAGTGLVSTRAKPSLPNPRLWRRSKVAFLVLDRKPTFIYSWLGLENFTIASSDPLPRGSCTIRFDFAYDGVGPGKGGTGTLSVNEKTVAEGRLEKTVPILCSTTGK